MSNTFHHRNQRKNRKGYDYGGKYKHNKHYGGGYGTDGRDAADSERRAQSKTIIAEALDEEEMAPVEWSEEGGFYDLLD